jgi:hypothetical protein
VRTRGEALGSASPPVQKTGAKADLDPVEKTFRKLAAQSSTKKGDYDPSSSRFHRTAAYTRCLRCAGAPRRPASVSGLSLLIPSWHAVLSDPGESDIDIQNFDADIAFAE